jgi:mannose-6-phosphate isomerase-like protein (cupin superfamily)
MHALDRVKAYACVGDHEQYSWKPMPWPGISNKVLFCDSILGTTIELAKIEKGAVFPVHYHPTVQTLFLIKGRIRSEGRTMTVGTFDVIPAGERHGGYVAEEESIQYKLFSAMPVYFMENGEVYHYKYDGTVVRLEPGSPKALSSQNIMAI